MRAAIIGAGSWGTVVAAVAAGNAETVTLWARRPALADTLAATRRNDAYAPTVALPESVEVTSDLARAVDGADIVALAVPSVGFRDVLAAAAPFIAPDVPVVSLAKGLEARSGLRMTQVATEVLARPADRIGVLTGPNIAAEIADGLPSASVVAFPEAGAAAAVQRLFMTPRLRVYTNPDVVGCEICAVTKNVIALAAGIADGLGCGDNARAALITRGLAEITRLGLAVGGQPESFVGLAGLGDIVVTATSRASRNRAVGEALGRGRPLADVLSGMSMVAEGVPSTGAVLRLAAAAGVEMPIAEQVAAVLDGRCPPAAALEALMGRDARSELEVPPAGRRRRA